MTSGVERIRVTGAPGSPYTRKFLAVLRYRRIPFALLLPGWGEGLPEPRVRLLPTVYLPGADGRLEAATDSSPLIRRLEAMVPERPLLPQDPALRLLDAVIEDYGDEWLTKCMFHYRWAFHADADKAARVLPNWGRAVSDEALAAAARMFRERQVGRLRYVGSSETTAPVIEASYRRLLAALERRLSESPFLLGRRPGAGDFGLFGQLTQLVAFDPTPAAIAAEAAPRVTAWTQVLEDLSGLEPAEDGWEAVESLPGSVQDILAEIGRVYAPLLLANAAAAAAGREEVAVEIDGREWRQAVFPYHVKCLAWLREAHAGLGAEDRRRLVPVLEAAGLAPLFA